jgi:hypothetical protein
MESQKENKLEEKLGTVSWSVGELMSKNILHWVKLNGDCQTHYFVEIKTLTSCCNVTYVVVKTRYDRDTKSL